MRMIRNRLKLILAGGSAIRDSSLAAAVILVAITVTMWVGSQSLTVGIWRVEADRVARGLSFTKLNRSKSSTKYLYPLLCPDLSASIKYADKSTVTTGSNLTYTIVLNNGGGGGAFVLTSDTIPPHVIYIAGSARVDPPGRGILTDTESFVEWGGTLASHDVLTITIPVQVEESAPHDTTVSNTARISYNGTQISRTVAVTVIDDSSPFFWDFDPQRWITTTQTPTCTIHVQDVSSGLDTDSAGCQFSTDGGISWSDCTTVVCPGTDGTTDAQTITIANVGFGQDSKTQNRVKFSIADMAGNVGVSEVYTVPIDTTEPGSWAGFEPSELVTTTRAPTCTIWVSDTTSGLDITSASYRYTTSGGVNWSDWISAECSGEDGITVPQIVTAANVPFHHNSITENQIEFKISDMTGIAGFSGTYTVKISKPYRIYFPLIMRCFALPLQNGGFEIMAGDFAAYWGRDGGLGVSITDTLSNGEPCRSGERCALIGNPNYPCNGIPLTYGLLSQTFAVPSEAPKLSFYYRIFSYDELKDAKYDSFDVYVENVCDGEAPVMILQDGSQDSKYGCGSNKLDITEWKLFELDLSSFTAFDDPDGPSYDYRGKSIRLSFYVYSREQPPWTVGWYNTWVYVDDVAVR